MWLQLGSADWTIQQGEAQEIFTQLPYILLHRSFADREVQATAFRAQIQLALRYNLPLVLHVRDHSRSWDGGLAEEDCYRILKECNVPRDFPIHRHCFNGEAFPLKKVNFPQH